MEPGEYDHQAVEAAARALWETHDVYRYDRAGHGPVFSVDTPPPYVSAAHLHVGHAMSYSQPDFIVRYRRMRGERVFYPIGFDDNGLPTERYVEQAYGVRAVDMPRAEFVALCLAETQRTAERYEDLWRRLGLSVDWSLRYSTIDARCQRTAQTSFVTLHEAGYLRRAQDPILWCPEDRTSLAQADVEDLERTSRLHTIRFGGGPADRDHPARAAAGLRGAVPPSRRHPLPRAHHGAGAAVRLRGAGAGRPGRGPGVRHRADDGVHVRRQRGRAAVAARPPGPAAGGGAGRAPGRAGGTVRRADRDPGAFGHRQGAGRGRAAGLAACRSGRWSGCTSGARPRWSSRSGRSGSSRCASTPTGSGPARPSWSGSRRSCGGGWKTGSTGSSGTGTSPGSGATEYRSRSGSAPPATRRSWPGSRTCRSIRSPTSRPRRPAQAAVTAS